MNRFLHALQTDGQLQTVLIFFGVIAILGLVILFFRGKHPVNPSRATEDPGRKRGQEGEAHVRHQLYFLDRADYTSLFSLHLPYLGKRQEFDAVTVGKNGLFAIEVKAWKGERLEITKDRQFVMKSGRSTSVKTSPVAQLQRHAQVLSEISQLPVTSILVIDNDHLLLENHSDLTVVTTQLLNDTILRHQGQTLSKVQRGALVQKLKHLTENQ